MNKTSRKLIASLVAKQTLTSGISPNFVRQLAAYLLIENRTNELQPLLRDIQADWAKTGYLNATAVSARPIDQQAKDLVKKTLSGAFPLAKTITVSELQDPSVIAGLRIEMSDSQLDLTVATKLNKFKQLTTKEG